LNVSDICRSAFEQGLEDGSPAFTGCVDETVYAFFSFLLGSQIPVCACGGVEAFQRATEAMISSWER